MRRAELATPRFRGYLSIARRSKTLLPPAVLRRGRYDLNFIVHQAANVFHNRKRPTIEGDSVATTYDQREPKPNIYQIAWNALATTD